MAKFLVALIPDDDDSVVSFPDGTYAIAEIVDKNDLYSDDDYQDMGLYLARALGRKVHRSGWPKSGSTAPPEPPVEPEVDIPAPAPAQNYPEGSCPQCGQMMVMTGRGNICPSGCGEELDNMTERPIAGGLKTYPATRESPKPTSMPTNDIIPPTD